MHGNSGDGCSYITCPTLYIYGLLIVFCWHCVSLAIAQVPTFGTDRCGHKTFSIHFAKLRRSLCIYVLSALLSTLRSGPFVGKLLSHLLFDTCNGLPVFYSGPCESIHVVGGDDGHTERPFNSLYVCYRRGAGWRKRRRIRKTCISYDIEIEYSREL